MAEVVRVTDQWGRAITLPAENWSDKILLDHGEMLDNESAVQRTLADPDVVTFDKDYADRELYYRRGALPPPFRQTYLKVCVAFQLTPGGTATGRVATAYATDRVKPGERGKWKR